MDQAMVKHLNKQTSNLEKRENNRKVIRRIRGNRSLNEEPNLTLKINKSAIEASQTPPPLLPSTHTTAEIQSKKRRNSFLPGGRKSRERRNAIFNGFRTIVERPFRFRAGAGRTRSFLPM